MAFESVKTTTGTIWEPKITGSKKEGNLQDLQPTDKSYIDGWYLGTEEIPKKTGNGVSKLHKLKFKAVGDKNHLLGDPKETNGEVSIWGTGVLDDNMTKVAPGSLIRIVWEGKKVSKVSGNGYHTWDVLVDKDAEPLDVFAGDNEEDVPEMPAPQATEKAATEAEVDDDLPF